VVDRSGYDVNRPGRDRELARFRATLDPADSPLRICGEDCRIDHDRDVTDPAGNGRQTPSNAR
jgi:hypothetical protein